MIKLKPIKPKGLEAAFKRLPDAVQQGMEDAAEAVKKDFEKTTQGWEHKVNFTVEQTGPADYAVGTDDEIWGWVDRGTKAHDITPRNARRLRFAVGGRAKTRPGIAVSGPGAKGSTIVFSRAVHHPGTKPRRFSEIIAKKWRRGVQPFIRDAIEKALR